MTQAVRDSVSEAGRSVKPCMTSWCHWRPFRAGMALAAALACLSPLQVDAALEADIVTTRGTITVVMDHQRAPRAVANLITLAEGSRRWVDPLSGRVRMDGYFDGLPVAAVNNSSAEKWLAIGDVSGTGENGPGYAFQDELDETLTHGPYVLTMVNDGPNTQGGGFLITGNLALPQWNGRNTVFGNVTDAGSRTVVDQILAAGANQTTVLSVGLRRTDPSAMAFDELAVALPEVSAPFSPLSVVPGVAVKWLGSQPPRSVLRAYQSTDLAQWSPHYRHMLGLDGISPVDGQKIDDADLPSRFYHFSLVNHPDAGGFTSFANRTLTIESPGVGTLIYRFGPTGAAGTYENIVFTGEPPFFSGTFQVSSAEAPEFEPYSFKILLFAAGLGGSPFNLIRGGLDETHPNHVSGRHRTLFMSASMTPVFEDMGILSVTRP